MSGMSNTTGKAIDGNEHLSQSIADILNTPLGSRVMNRSYGSNIFELIDAPGNPASFLKLYAAAIDALLRWESRILPVRVQVTGGELDKGVFELALDGITTEAVNGFESGSLVQLIVPVGGGLV
ncbi:MAG: GPW/gp25 family protein [Candidatus Pacearchaeota archaeon]|nr:GPW/gp25 family protein [Candidatus Pacearchaeota archaeon]